MDDALVERIRADMAREAARTGPPEGFPRFPDLPVGRHTSQAFWDLEQTHLWPRVWVLAGRVEDVPEPGDYLCFDHLGVPLVIVRGRDRRLRAFHNTCRHRGAPVVRGSRGQARQLRCQYHSWTYDTDTGTLVSLPDERDFVGLDKAARCLAPAACDTFGGFVFVSRDPQAPSLHQWIGPAAELLAPFRCEELREVYRESVDVPCNWKVTAEAFLEVYHFRHIHSRDGVAVLDNRGAAMGLYPHGHSRMVTPFSAQNCQRLGLAGWDDWRHLDQGPFPTIDGVPPIVDCTNVAVSLFPNMIVPLARTGFPVNLFWPLDRGTTRLEWIYYAPKDWDGDDLPPHWERMRRIYNRIMDEDMANMAPMQRSMASPVFSGMPLNYQERRIWHLHEEIDRLIGPERIPPELRVEPLLGPWVEGAVAPPAEGVAARPQRWTGGGGNP